MSNANSEEAFNIRIGYLKPETVEIAKNELRETPEVKEAAIKELRELLHAATDINYKDDDEFLVIFLRACHFYPQSALEKMRTTAAFRKDNAALVHGLLIEQLKDIFIQYGIVNVLKNCDQHGRRVMIVNCGELWDPNSVPSDDVFRMLYMVHIAAQLEPETQVRGVVCIMDFDGLSMKQVKALSPTFSKRLLTFIQDAMPLRMKEVHFVKQPFIFKLVWALFKPFVREKLNKRMHFHGSDMKSLQKFLSPEILPENYKGTQPKIDYGGADWFTPLEKHADFVREWSELGPAKW
ncbi:clavesin-1 [Bactrocera neohumeralis]|uniref:clavesin-1 n=1 Tax=Bactrocera tryoni TaxID=59916 RepID=UPI001A956A9A|nr:clavesin-1 [Bactrocera tryoni]XP_039952758.1 clavesin-1 [Bactrocera tryoni]XP_050321082.1 clavesin-1 [Bactrocera neohumeralis]XP_050321083.1 clavesin-1 [Bactrocera neohumeralis]